LLQTVLSNRVHPIEFTLLKRFAEEFLGEIARPKQQMIHSAKVCLTIHDLPEDASFLAIHCI